LVSRKPELKQLVRQDVLVWGLDPLGHQSIPPLLPKPKNKQTNQKKKKKKEKKIKETVNVSPLAPAFSLPTWSYVVITPHRSVSPSRLTKRRFITTLEGDLASFPKEEILHHSSAQKGNLVVAMPSC